MEDKDRKVVAAHDQKLTLHVIAHIPEHFDRADNPNKHLFDQTKARLKKLGLWKCVIDDDYCGGQAELHHSHIEDSQAEGMDFKRVNEVLGLHIESDEEFQEWIQSPGNLEVLCTNHHRTHFGVHSLPQPLWEPLRYRKIGVKAGGEVVKNEDKNGGIRGS